MNLFYEWRPGNYLTKKNLHIRKNKNIKTTLYTYMPLYIKEVDIYIYC